VKHDTGRSGLALGQVERSLSRSIPTSTARSVRFSSQSIRSSALRVAPELADPVGPLEVGEHQDVEESSTGERSGRELQPGGFQTTALGLGSKFQPGEIEPDEPPVRTRERPEDVPEHPLALDP
jgi:hypothetical protein